MNKEQASFYQNESKTLILEPPIATSLQGDLNILPHNLNHHPKNILSYPNLGYQYRSNLHLEHQKHEPGPFSVNENVYPSPPMPILEPEQTESFYGSELVSSQFLTRTSFDSIQISDPSITGNFAQPMMKYTERNLLSNTSSQNIKQTHSKSEALFTGINGSMNACTKFLLTIFTIYCTILKHQIRWSAPLLMGLKLINPIQVIQERRDSIYATGYLGLFSCLRTLIFQNK